MITIDQLLESVDLDFEPRWVTKDSDKEDGCICAWDTKPTKQLTYWQKTDSKKDKWAIIGYIKTAEFENKPWQECIYEVPRKTMGKIEKIHIPEMDEVAESAMYSKELARRLNQVIDAVNKRADIIQQIGDWGTRKGECLWCETLTKFEPNELKGANNG